MKTGLRRYGILGIGLFLTILLSSCGGGGGGGSDSDAPAGMVTLNAEDIAGPGGELFYQGKEYTGKVEVPEDALVGVIKDGQSYLYHPSMGKPEFTENTSREAVTRFVVGKNAEPQSLSSANSVDEMEQMYAIAVVEDIEAETDLPTKVHISRDENKLTITNQANRWAAIKITSGSSEQIYFIPPRARILDSNLARWVASDQGSDIFKDLPGDSNWKDNFSTSSNLTITVDPPATIETFGAVFRASPICLVNVNLFPRVQEAWMADHALVLCLNTIDMYYVALEGIKHLTQLVPLSCMDAATGALLNMVEAWFLGYMTQEERIASQWYQILVEDVANSVFQCMLLAPTAMSFEFVSTFWNILTAGDYFLEDIVFVDPIFTNAASYASANITDDLAASFSRAPSTLSTGETETWEVTIVGGKPPYRAKFTWDDGMVSEFTTAGASVSMNREFSDAGSYTLSVMVVDANADARQIASSVKVSDAQPKDLGVTFIAEPATLKPNQAGTWSISVSDAVFPVMITFDWGDGINKKMSGSESPISASHKYAEEGTYTVEVTVTDKDNASGQAAATVSVEAETIEDCVNVSGQWSVRISHVQQCDFEKQTYPDVVRPANIDQDSCDIDLGGGMSGSLTGDQVSITAPFKHNDMTKTLVLTGTATGTKMVLQGTVAFQESWQICTYDVKYDFYR